MRSGKAFDVMNLRFAAGQLNSVRVLIDWMLITQDLSGVIIAEIKFLKKRQIA